jgi:hypothetical protein
MEEEHIVFLAELEWKLSHRGQKVDVEVLRKSARAAMDGLRGGDGTHPVTSDAARGMINDGPAATLLRAGLKAGAAATCAPARAKTQEQR